MALVFEQIEGYAEMTAEEKLAALEGLEIPTDEGAKWKKQYDKTAHELAEAKKANKALQEQVDSKLTEDEKNEAERKKQIEAIMAENEALKRESAISKTAAQYIGLGYSQELAESTANALYDNDLETVLANAGQYKTELEHSIRANVVKSNPTPDGMKGSSTKSMTKEEIMAIKDRTARQAAIAEHIELFTK